MQVNQSTPTVTVVVSDSPSSVSTPPSSSALPELMPGVTQLACSGDPGAMVAALAIESSKTQRDFARTERDHALTAQSKAEAAEVEDMHNKANLQRAQGIVDGTLQMGQGATDLASGLNDANAARQQAGAEANSADLKQNAGAYSQTHQDALQASANTLSMGAATSKTDAAWSRAGGSVLAGGKSVADGLLGGAITDDDASAKVHDAAAQSFKQIADDAHDNERDAQAQIDKAIDFYKEYVDTKNQAAMAAIQRA